MSKKKEDAIIAPAREKREGEKKNSFGIGKVDRKKGFMVQVIRVAYI